MKMSRKTVAAMVVFGVISVFGLCACQARSQSAPQDTSSPQSETPKPTQATTQTAKLYIGVAEQYNEVTMEYEGSLTPEKLIEGIAQETGWNLDLYSEVTSGKGGMTVEFAPSAAIFTGPPEQQKDAYHVYEPVGLVEAVLGSITTTLQNNFVDVQVGGDPKSLDVYFCQQGNQPISLDDISFHLPIDAPYTNVDDFITRGQ